MPTRLYFLLVMIPIFLTLFTCKQRQSVTVERSPNILLILTDDMGYGDVANIGNPVIETPHLDRLASQSVNFRNFYVSPVCAPTRASLLTGRYHQRTGVRSVTNGYETMDPTEITLAEILSDHGYRTGIFGKWHLGEYYPSVPNAQGFQEYLGFRTGHTNYYYDATIEHNGIPAETKGHITEVLTDKALTFMTEESEEPFFCYLAYNAPHTPLQVDSSWWAPYTASGLEEREARVYGMIEQLDQGVGKIMAALEAGQLIKNTIVIFMSDNGPINGWRVPQQQMRFNAGLRDQKFTTYEGGIRTQCYWKWQGRWQPRVSEQIAAHIDVVPTLLDILGISTLAGIRRFDGISLKNNLESGALVPDRMFFQKYSLETLRDPAPFPGGIARQGPWKMANGEALYNLEQDIGETLNLAEKHPDIFSKLKAAYLEWYQDISDDHDLKPVEITVGHPQENPVYLQPHHAIASGEVKFWGNRGLVGERKGTHPMGVDSDWTGGWHTKGDALEWQVLFVVEGNYHFRITARDTTTSSVEAISFTVNQQEVENALEKIDLTPHWSEYLLGFLPVAVTSAALKIRLEDDIESNLEIKSLVVEKIQ